MHRTPFRPLWTELKGFGSRRTVAGSPDGVHDCSMALRRFAPKDVLRETFLTQLAVAPDGSSVVYGRRTIEDGAYRTRLWRVPTSGGRAEQITTGDERRAASVLARTGTTLVFMSGRSGKAQPWLLPLAGGEPRPLAEFAGQAGAAEWSPDGARIAVLAQSGEERFRVGDQEQPTARRISRSQLAPRRRRHPRPVHEPLGRPRARRASRNGSPRPATRSSRRSGARTASGSAFLADPRPEAGVLEQPQVWSLRADGGRATKHAELARGDRRRRVLAEREARLRRAGRPVVRRVDEPRAVGARGRRAARARRGARPHVLLHRHRRPARLRRACAGAGALARRRERRRRRSPTAAAAFRTASGSTARSSGSSSATTRCARGSRSAAAGSRRSRASTAARATSSRSRTATCGGCRATAAAGSARIAGIRSGTRCATATGTRSTRGSSGRGSPQQGPRPPDPRRPALRPRARAVAGDGRARRRRLHVLYGNPRGSQGYGEAYGKAIEGNWGEADDSDLHARSSTGRSGRSSRPATTSACSGSPTAAT